jgi:hypothetical protein
VGEGRTGLIEVSEDRVDVETRVDEEVRLALNVVVPLQVPNAD